MADDPKDGGPAFPSVYGGPGRGMSLRDWIAGQALAGFTAYDRRAAVQVAKNDGRDPADVLASWVYAIADAMLAKREGK